MIVFGYDVMVGCLIYMICGLWMGIWW